MMNDPGTRIRRILPWVSMIREVCEATGEDPFRFASLGYRESQWTWSPGYYPRGSTDGWGDDPDGPGGRLGYGYGIFQIDRRFHRSFLMRADCKDPKVQAMYACKILRDNRRAFMSSVITVHGDELERCTYAAYNAGYGRVAHQVIVGSGMGTHGDPDLVTTGKNYSKWIFTMASALKARVPRLFEFKVITT